ncbi:MAG: hypothetical protein JXB25_05975 [Deltaproteobacteria bacterium]|nr:hypothetical protein [Deltaproteobacteria bacterium]
MRLHGRVWGKALFGLTIGGISGIQRFLVFALVAFQFGGCCPESQGSGSPQGPRLAIDIYPWQKSLKETITRLLPQSHWPEFPAASPPEILSYFLVLNCSGIDRTASEIETLRMRAEDARKELGLDLRLRYNQSFGEGDSFRDSCHTYTAGLVWDLIDEGFLEQRQLAREIDLKRQLAQLRYPQQRMLELYPCRDNAIFEYFGRKRLDLAIDRLALLQPYVQLLRRGYFSGGRYVDDLYRMEDELHRTQTLVETYARRSRIGEGNRGDGLDCQEAPLVELNLEEMMRALLKEGMAERALWLESQILKNRHNPLFNLELEVFADTSAIDDPETGSDKDFRFGAQLRIPLILGHSRRLQGEMDQVRLKYAGESQDVSLELAKRHAGYRGKLADALRMYYRGLILQERFRRALHALESASPSMARGDDALSAAAGCLLELLDARMEMLSVQESCYRQILYLLTGAGLEYSPDFFKPFFLNTSRVRGRMGDRTVYVWSATFNGLSNDTILDFFAAKAVTRVLVSAGAKTRRDKLVEFLDAARRRGVEVELVVSDNQWIFPEKEKVAEQTAGHLLALCPNLHLDIEPHTLKGYRLDKAGYWRLYLNLVTRLDGVVRQAGGHLSVSLPVRVEPELVRRLVPLVERIFVMAYGRTKVDGIRRGLEPFAQVDRERLSIALRPADFPDEPCLEGFIDKVIKDTGVHGISIHALRHYLDLTGKETQ